MLVFAACYSELTGGFSGTYKKKSQKQLKQDPIRTQLKRLHPEITELFFTTNRLPDSFGVSGVTKGFPVARIR